jgi:DnaA family protein
VTQQLLPGVRLRDTSLFSSYFAGRNQPAVAALMSLRRDIDEPATRNPTCVWLHGPAGVGKTHLLQALCARAGAEGESAAYVPLASVASHGTESLTGLGQLSYVCIDDAEAVAGDDAWERALFQLHQQLDEQRGRLVVASASTPAALAFRLRDLASRMNGGLVLTLRVLDDDERIAALKLRASVRGFELPDDVAQYLLRHLPRDMTHLYSALDQLDVATLVEKRRLSVAFVRKVLGEAVKT